MLNVNNVRLQFGGRVLFEEVNLKFVAGNCYGVIGANGAGKSTFLKILDGTLEPNKGDVTIEKRKRMSVLSQNQNEYDQYTVLDTVLLGFKRLVEVMHEKDAIYQKEDFSEADGIRASELEGEFAEMGGWEAESDAQILLNALKVEKKALVVLPGMDEKLIKSFANIPGVKTTQANNINVYDILNCDHMIFDKSAVAIVEEVYKAC